MRKNKLSKEGTDGVGGEGSGGECARQRNGAWAELVARENVAHMAQGLSRATGPRAQDALEHVLEGGCMEQHGEDIFASMSTNLNIVAASGESPRGGGADNKGQKPYGASEPRM